MSAHHSEEDLRGLCARILSAAAEADDSEVMAVDPELAHEIESRLAACGVDLHRASGARPVAVIRGRDDELSELSRAALALCALVLCERTPTGARSRLTVEEIAKRLGGKYQPFYIRRAVLGPLEVRGLVSVVKPAQRASDAYVVAGPMLAVIDAEVIRARLESLRGVA